MANQKLGLQRESISNLGNNLFGIVFGSAIAIVSILAYDNELLTEIFNGSILEVCARLIPIIGVLLIVLYYLIDWYDLNLVVYIDEYVGRRQVLNYVLAALVISSLPPLALNGKLNVAAFVAAPYFAFAAFLRNRELRDGHDHLTNKEELVAYGERRRDIVILRGFLCLISIATFAMAVWNTWNNTPGSMLGVAISLVLLLGVAYALKILRSVHFLQKEYERRIRAATPDAN